MITIGSDPELFLVRGSKFISAVGKCDGTKEKPFEWQKGFNIHNDNVAMEFNVPPARNREQFVANHHQSLVYCRSIAKKFGCNLKIVGDALFTEEELDTPEAKVFGCDPDFNAWTLSENPPPQSDEPLLRTAGGHIHIGGVPDFTFRDKVELVRTLDLFVGIPLALLEPDSRRNELYGKPGAMRNKPYGVEWRTPSNFWLRKTSTIGGIFNMVYSIVENMDHFIPIMRNVADDLELLNSPVKYKKWAQRAIRPDGSLYMGEVHGPLFQGV